ncbi:hypothetical protein, partial [Bartonella bovis]|uniref:hypothetical protein n=1 Tax=Bartonella bovis TaxID=155194 RepID=UPI0011AF0272
MFKPHSDYHLLIISTHAIDSAQLNMHMQCMSDVSLRYFAYLPVPQPAAITGLWLCRAVPVSAIQMLLPVSGIVV